MLEDLAVEALQVEVVVVVDQQVAGQPFLLKRVKAIGMIQA